MNQFVCSHLVLALSPQDRRPCVHKVTSGAADIDPKLRETLDLYVCVHTIRITSKQESVRLQLRPKCPFFPGLIGGTDRVCSGALVLDSELLEEDIWSCETMINGVGPDRRVWGWKETGPEQ
jgi:hypothetical protein